MISMIFYKNKEFVVIGVGVVVFGYLVYVVVWLVNKLFDFDICLKVGELILLGVLFVVVLVVSGDVVKVEFGFFGLVFVCFE